MNKQIVAFLLCFLMVATAVIPAEAEGKLRKTDEGFVTPGESYNMLVHRVDSNGVSIYGRLYLPLDFDETREYPVMIFSHGFNDTCEGFDGYAATMVQNGWIGYSFDFVGGSAGGRRTKGSIYEMSVVTERQNLLDVVEDICGLPYVDSSRLVLCGASQGGAVTSMTSAVLQEKVAAEVLIYPALMIGSDVHERFATIDDIPEKLKVNDTPIGRIYYADLWDLCIADEAVKYTGPVLILHGNADQLVPLSVSQEQLPRFADASLVEVDGAGHGYSAPMRAAFDAEVLSFLAEKGITSGK